MSSSDSDRKSTSRKKCVAVAVVIFVVMIAVALALGLSLGLRASAPTTDHLLRRVDCYPEARWGGGGGRTVDRADCERRGCRYDLTPSTAVDAGAPVCYVSADSALGAGYSLSDVDERPDGFTARLQTNTRDQSDIMVQPLSALLQVDYAGENVLHLKVRLRQ